MKYKKKLAYTAFGTIKIIFRKVHGLEYCHQKSFYIFWQYSSYYIIQNSMIFNMDDERIMDDCRPKIT